LSASLTSPHIFSGAAGAVAIGAEASGGTAFELAAFGPGVPLFGGEDVLPEDDLADFVAGAEGAGVDATDGRRFASVVKESTESS
jgi:hypothetical protein